MNDVDASRFLQAIARRIADAYIAHTHPRAILLTGSAAAGESDGYSDIDFIAYYDELPSDAQRGAAGAQLAAELGAIPLSRPHGDWYAIRGVECQVAQGTIEMWDQQLARAMGPQFVEGDQKALSGLLQGIALHGEALIRERQARVASYPEALARATVERYLHFPPIWRAPEYFARRDAALWFHQTVAEACLNVLGVLAGLNHRYYSTFQFKRMRAFIAGLDLAPADLADRIERVLASISRDPAAVASELESLAGETVGLVETHMPDVDTSSARQYLGHRFEPWQPLPM
jgi:hypothetical protein